MNERSQKVLEALWKISKDGAQEVRPSNLLDRLRKRTILPDLELGLALGELRDEGLVVCSRWLAQPTRPGAMVTVAKPDRPDPEWLKRWRGILNDADLNPKEIQALLPAGATINLSVPDSLRLIEGLKRLRDDQGALAGVPLYDVSARYLLGSSKLLEKIGKAARAFGIAIEAFSPPYRYMALAGNPDPKAFTLVENPHSFEAAVRADARLESAWACSYGFGFSMDQRYAELLASNLTNTVYFDNLIILIRAGEPPTLTDLLGCERLFFWGDLDLEGLRIYQELKKRFPNIRPSPLYEPMAEILAAGGGHPYVKLVGKDGQRPPAAGDPEVDRLAALCRERGLDQEAVDPGTEWSRLG